MKPCCHTTWDWIDEILVEVHCTGVMNLDTDDLEYTCDTCFNHCGAWSHEWAAHT